MNAKAEGRYDILKGLERAWSDRGHKAPLEAHLGNLADQYKKDMDAVKVLLDFAKNNITYLNPEVSAAIEKVERIFPLAKDTIWDS